MIYRATVPAEIAEIPAKKFCCRYLGLSNRLWKRMKWQGWTKVNGENVKVAVTLLHGGDEFVGYLPETDNLTPPPSDEILPALEIIYEDKYLLAVNKPAGLLVHPAPGEKISLFGAAVLKYYAERGEEAIFHLVHRLDRQTSGLLLVARRPEVQNMLFYNAEKSGEKLFSRSYLAVVKGVLPEMKGMIDLPLGPKEGSRVEQCVRFDDFGKRAVTDYRVVAIAPPLSLLYVTLRTGRTHQIRAHFAHLGYPLLGDDLYGPPRGENEIIRRQALHAVKITLAMPWKNFQTLTLYAPPPDDIAAVIEMCLKGAIVDEDLAEEINSVRSAECGVWS